MSTVGISLVRTITVAIKPPRTYFLRYPFGHALGEAGNRPQQTTIFKDCLNLLETARVPGIILESPYRWRGQRFA